MLYFAEVELTPGKVSQLVMLAKVDIEGETTYFDFKSLLGNDRVANFLASYGDKILIDALGEEDNLLPFPVVNPSSLESSLVVSTVVYKFFSGNPDFTDFDLMAQKIGNPLFSAEILKRYKESFDTIKKYIKGEENFKVSVPEMFYSNPLVLRQVVKDYNGKFGHQFQFANINKTNFMNSETDQFFIELPDYEKLRSLDLGLRSMVPEPQDIAKPYPHPIYQTPYAARVFKESPTQLRQSLREVNDLIELTPEEMESVPKINVQYLEGNSANNDLDIQPNEMEFYAALEEYIKYDIAQSFPGADVEEKFANCVCSSRMMEFLQLMLESVAKLNWSHTNKFPIGYSDDEDDEGDSTSMSESAMYLNLGEMDVTDGLTILEKFIDSASKNGQGFHAYIEAIIRLARFGDVKPTVLKLGNYNRYLDLNTFYIKHTTGNLSSLQPVLINGSEMAYEGVVVFDDKFRDVKFRESIGVDTPKVTIPVGVYCRKDFSGNAHQTVFLSFTDIISTYKNSPDRKLIDGITFDGTKFVTDFKSTDEESIPLRMARESVNSTTDKSFVFYSSEGMKQLTLEFSCPEITSLAVMFEFLYSNDALSRQYDQLKFSSKEELASKLSSNPLPVDMYVKVNLAGALIPIVLKASEKYESVFTGEYDIAQILNMYLEVSRALGFESEAQMISKGTAGQASEQPTQTSPDLQKTEQKLEKMQTFTSQKESSSVDMQSILISPIKEEENVTTIVEGGKIVGGFVSRKGEGNARVFVVGDLSVVPEGARPSANTLLSIETLVFDALWNIVAGTPERAQVRFHSVDTVKYYRSLLNEKLKSMAKKG